MNHAITIGGLLLSVGAVLGISAAGLGALMLSAESMSDAPDTSGGGGIAGCSVLIGGAVIGLLCIVGLVL